MSVPMSLLLQNLIGLFLLMAVGVAIVQLRILPAETIPMLSHLLMTVLSPAMVFHSLLRPFEKKFLHDSLVVAVLGLGLYLFLIGCSLGATRVFRISREHRGTWAICATFPNNGFMGFPVIQAVLGNEALALAAIMGISFSMLVYTIGVWVMLSDRPLKSGALRIGLRKLLFIPVNISTALGLTFFLLQIPVPEVVALPIEHLANMATTLSMIIVGMKLAKTSGIRAMVSWEVLTGTLMRLLIIPGITYLLLLVLPISNPLMAPMILITMAMPSASCVVAIAEEYGVNVDLTVEVNFLSGMLCIVTVPLIALLL